MLSTFRLAVQAAQRHKELYFAGLLSDQDISSAYGDASCRTRRWLYSPLITLTVFLSQCLSDDHSCRKAVSQLLAWRTKNNLPPCSTDTGAYCTARDELPEEVCRALAQNIGRATDQEAPQGWLWKGRRAYVVDGSTVTMPDTAANQAEYPQESQQSKGLGFPIARIIVVFSLAVGTAVAMSIGKYGGKLTGENSMFRRLATFFKPGDVVIMDRAYSGWFDMMLCKQKGLDVIVRKNASRRADFRRGKQLARSDHIITINKPGRPHWLDKQQYDAMPDDMEIRQTRIHVHQRGFRTQVIIIETTLLDDQQYTSQDLGDAFRLRWNAELNLRSLKSVLQMAHLRCKVPHRVRNEFHMHLLAYNLLRRTIALAAIAASVRPWQVSFKAALQTLTEFLAIFASNTDLDAWCDNLLWAIASHRIANRPDRYEPRAIKRRFKKYPRLSKPRQELKMAFQ